MSTPRQNISTIMEYNDDDAGDVFDNPDPIYTSTPRTNVQQQMMQLPPLASCRQGAVARQNQPDLSVYERQGARPKTRKPSQVRSPVKTRTKTGAKPAVELKPKAYICQICNSGFDRKFNRDRHVVTVHKNLNQGAAPMNTGARRKDQTGAGARFARWKIP